VWPQRWYTLGMPDMSKPQSLFKRGNVWWYQRRIPRDLIHKFQGQTVLKESLGTQDYAEAKILRNRVAVEFEAQFKAAKAASKAQSPVTKNRSKAEILRLVRDYVRREDAERDENYWRTDWSAHPEGLPSGLKQAAELIELYKDPSGDETWKAICRTGQAIFGPTDILELEENWQYLHRAVLELEKRELARMSGDYQHATYDHLFADEHNYRIPPRTSQTAIRLDDLIEQYRAEYAKTHSVGEKRVAKLNASLQLIIRFFGRETLATDIDRKRCREYRDILNELPSNISKRFPNPRLSLDEIAVQAKKQRMPVLAAETQATYLSVLKQLLTWAQRERHITRNEADGLNPLAEKQSAKDARDPFTIEQLTQIFNAPLYRGCRDDQSGYAIKGRNVIRGTRFWVPLIALYTGMRLNEICQLDVVDIQQSKAGTWFISVNVNSPGKLVKNDPSKRDLPIHSDIIAMGFLKFLDQQKGSAKKKLFSDLKRTGRGYHSEHMSRWFSQRFLLKAGAKTDKTSFHSFRHNFRDILRVIDAPLAVVQRLGGWQAEEGVSRHYGKGLSVDNLAPWVERIRYEGLDLKHLHEKNDALR
jgi:integrase